MDQRCDLSITEQRAELFGRLVPRFSYGSQLPEVQLRSSPPPQQCPQFVIGVEAHPMINSEHSPGARKNVASLAISVVDQDIEYGEQPEVSNIGVDHRHWAIVRIKTFHGRKPAVFGYGRARNKIDELVCGCLVDVDPHLKRPEPEWPVGKHRDRYAVEAPDPGHLVRGHLSEAEGAAREVPERTLSL